MLSWILQLLASPILGSISDGWKAWLAARNSQDVLAVELATEELKAEIEARKIAHATLLIENGRWWTAVPRSAVQWTVAIFFVKCVLWDTVLGLGETSWIKGPVGEWMGWIILAWFGTTSLERIAKVFTNRGR